MVPSRIPLVLAVTGHRTVDDEGSRLTDLLGEQLRRIAKRFTDTPFLLLTPLAEGADRLVARLCMAYLDAELIVPLPMPLEEYEKDFVTRESRAEFRELIGRAKRVFVVPGDENFTAGRDLAYARTGAYVAEHSQILIALWDGEPARGAGGTAEVVQWKASADIPDDLRPREEVRNTLNSLDTGCVMHVNTTTLQIRMLPNELKAKADYAVFDKISSFNRDVNRLENSDRKGLIEQSQTWLVGKEGSNPVLVEHPSFNYLKVLYGCADALAGHFKVANGRFMAWIFALFVLAVIFFGLIDWIQYLIIFYVIAFPAVGIIAYLARRRRLEDRSLDYRALAEGLRVMIFWRLVGIDERISSNYLSKHSGVLSWIRMSISNLELLLGPAKPPRAGQKTMSQQLAAQLWVGSELSFFRSRRTRISRWANRLSRISTVSFTATFGVAVVYSLTLVALNTDFWLTNGWDEDRIGSVFQAILGFLGAVGVAAEAIRSKKAYDEQERRYHLIEQLFSKAQARLGEKGCFPEDVFTALGKEALFENGEWLWIHRSLTGLPKG